MKKIHLLLLINSFFYPCHADPGSPYNLTTDGLKEENLQSPFLDISSQKHRPWSIEASKETLWPIQTIEKNALLLKKVREKPYIQQEVTPYLQTSRSLLLGPVSQKIYANQQDRVSILGDLYQRALMQSNVKDSFLTILVDDSMPEHKKRHLSALYLMQEAMTALVKNPLLGLKRSALFGYLIDQKETLETFSHGFLDNLFMLKILFPKGFFVNVAPYAYQYTENPHPKRLEHALAIKGAQHARKNKSFEISIKDGFFVDQDHKQTFAFDPENEQIIISTIHNGSLTFEEKFSIDLSYTEETNPFLQKEPILNTSTSEQISKKQHEEETLIDANKIKKIEEEQILIAEIELRQAEEEKEKFLDDISQNYIDAIRNAYKENGQVVWGGDIEIIEIANILNVQIIVHKPTVTYDIDEDDKVHVIIENVIPQPPIGPKDAASTINLWLQGGHYQIYYPDILPLKPINVPGDGNCLFHAVIRALPDKTIYPILTNNIEKTSVAADSTLQEVSALRHATADRYQTLIDDINKGVMVQWPGADNPVPLSNWDNMIWCRFNSIFEALDDRQLSAAKGDLPISPMRKQAVNIRKKINGALDFFEQKNFKE